MVIVESCKATTETSDVHADNMTNVDETSELQTKVTRLADEMCEILLCTAYKLFNDVLFNSSVIVDLERLSVSTFGMLIDDIALHPDTFSSVTLSNDEGMEAMAVFDTFKFNTLDVVFQDAGIVVIFLHADMSML